MSRTRRRVKTRWEFLKQSAMTAGMLPLFGGGNLSFAGVKSPLDPSAITKLRRSFSGHLVVPGDPDYDTARVPSMNPEVDRFPAIVAQCANEDDVLRCIDFSHQQKLEIAVRSGNQSFLGWGTCNNGIVVDLSRMKSVKVDAVQGTVHAGTGNTAQEILAATAPYSLAPILGQCGGVGAGLALGGGLGWLSGQFGATCDNLMSARLITADGRTLTADSTTNPDLFWAIRGAGGNFGIATSFQYQLHPVKEFLAGSFVYPATRARALLQFFREYMSSAPDDLQPDCWLTNHPNGRFMIRLVHTGNLDDGERLVDMFRSFTAPEQERMKRMPFSEVYRWSDADVEFAPYPFQSLKGTYIEQLSDEAINLILERFVQPPPSCAVTFDFGHYMHGQVCRVASDARAFGLRKPDAIHLVAIVQWKNRADMLPCLAWQNKTLELLQKYSNGHIYANYMSVTGATAASRTYGNNLDRLRQLKKKYDPENFFHLNQNILP